MENTILYNLQGEVPDEEDFLIPLGKANVVKEGTDLSIIAHGKSVHTSLQVAQTLEEKKQCLG
jgi:pyruvate dehydrogenase E1 component beta subunit